MSETYFVSKPQLALCKLESTEGSDPSPAVGTDDLVILGQPTIDMGYTRVPAMVESPTGGQWPTLLQSIFPRVTLKVPLYGVGQSASVIVAPQWAKSLFQSCGCLDMSESTGTVLRWWPLLGWARNVSTGGSATEAKTTFALYLYSGVRGGALDTGGSKRLHKMLGCRVSSIEIVYDVAGEPVHANVEVLGLYVAPADVTTTLLTADADGLLTDLVMANGGAVVIESQAARVSAMRIRIDYGAQHVPGDTSLHGAVAIGQTQLSITGSMNPLLLPSSTYDSDAAIYAGDDLEFAMTALTPQGRSANTGYSLSFEMVRAERTKSNDDRSGPYIRRADEFVCVQPTTTTDWTAKANVPFYLSVT